MKKLYLTGFTADDDGLILSPRKGAKSGGFTVALDDDLVASIEQACRRRNGEDGADGGVDGAADGARQSDVDRPRSALSPREIQARLRAGGSIHEVASQAGVEDEWIIRFAAPILAEQARVVEGAQRLTFAKARRGPSIEPLAASVQWNLSDRGVWFSDDVFADSWSAYNLHGARWAVRFAYTSRKRSQVAEWEVDLREQSLVARNRLAGELGHVEPGRRRPTAEPTHLTPADPAPVSVPVRAAGPPPAKSVSAPTATVAKVTKKPAIGPTDDGDRPSHLARPPSPMKMTNRATKFPTPSRTASAARPTPPPAPVRVILPPRPASAPPAEPVSARRRRVADASAPPATPAPTPATPAPTPATPAPTPATPAPTPAPPPAPKPVVSVEDETERPAIVVVPSSPLARRPVAAARPPAAANTAPPNAPRSRRLSRRSSGT